MKELCTYKFFTEYYFINHPSGNNRIKWKDIVKIIELKSAFLFFPTAKIAHIVPKRAFEGKKQELEVLRKVISKNLPK